MKEKLEEYIKELEKDSKLFWSESEKASNKDEMLRMRLCASEAKIIDEITEKLKLIIND